MLDRSLELTILWIKREERCMKKLKLFESILKVASALVATAISVVKIIGNMKTSKT